jgi:hypothetical protein
MRQENIDITLKGLNHTYGEHAADRGMTANWSPANGQWLANKIRDFVSNAPLVIQDVTFRGQVGTAFLDPRSGVMALRNAAGNLWTAYGIGAEQITNLIINKKFGGGP